MQAILNMNYYFWNKDTISLFDFNFVECDSGSLEISNTINIGKVKKEIIALLDMNYKLPDLIYLWKIEFRKNETVIVFPEYSKEKTYISIKHSFNHGINGSINGYKLKTNDTIKLGKVIIKIKEIGNKQSNYNISLNKKEKEKTFADGNDEIQMTSNNNFIQYEMNNAPQIVLNKRKSQKVYKNYACRICLGEENEEENPLISPCKCSGTMKLIHLECLKNWLKSKITVKTYNHMVSFSYTILQCELCLTEYSERIYYKNQYFDLLDTSFLKGKYFVLEEEIIKEDQPKCTYYIFFEDKKELSLGRSNDCDVRLSDISISRFHAVVQLNGDDIYLQDNDSKFGSLILIEDDISLILNKTLVLQNGKHCFFLEIKNSFLLDLCSCCFK